MNTQQAKKATEPTIHQIRQRSGYVTHCTWARSSILLNTTATSTVKWSKSNSTASENCHWTSLLGSFSPTRSGNCNSEKLQPVWKLEKVGEVIFFALFILIWPICLFRARAMTRMKSTLASKSWGRQTRTGWWTPGGTTPEPRPRIRTTTEAKTVSGRTTGTGRAGATVGTLPGNVGISLGTRNGRSRWKSWFQKS